MTEVFDCVQEDSIKTGSVEIERKVDENGVRDENSDVCVRAVIDRKTHRAVLDTNYMKTILPCETLPKEINAQLDQCMTRYPIVRPAP